MRTRRGPITYIPIARGFLYLAAVMDGFARVASSQKMRFTEVADQVRQTPAK
jgi:hypothetical protein